MQTAEGIIEGTGNRVHVAAVMWYRYDGDRARFSHDAVKRLSQTLDIDDGSWPQSARAALQDFAAVMSLIEDLPKWSASEQRELLKIIRAKATGDESRYLKLMQNHARLRKAMLKLGNASRD